MSDNKFADVCIKVPDGEFRNASIKINGLEMGHVINAFQLVLDHNENNLAIVTISFLADVELNGMFKIDSAYRAHRGRSAVHVYIPGKDPTT